ncbi:MAG TPA: hypothetical protein VGB73_20860 [Pyrinomonadaceae bacterium]
MTTLKETRELIEREPQHWCVHLMNFVDDFRYYKDARAIDEPFATGEPQMDALLASTAEALCDEMGLAPPRWLSEIPACGEPFFVGGLESLKAISIVESPLRFRMRKIFVLENFLSRV